MPRIFSERPQHLEKKTETVHNANKNVSPLKAWINVKMINWFSFATIYVWVLDRRVVSLSKKIKKKKINEKKKRVVILHVGCGVRAFTKFLFGMLLNLAENGANKTHFSFASYSYGNDEFRTVIDWIKVIKSNYSLACVLW